MLKKSIAVLIICLAVAWAFNSKRTNTEKVIEYADNLQTAISNFESTRGDLADDIGDGTKEIVESMGQEHPEVRTVAISWEKKWGAVKTRFADLESDLSNVGEQSQEYFTELENTADAIGDTSLKASEQDKNKRLKSKWTKAFEKATLDIQKLRQLIREGDDFQQVLIGAALRQKLEQNIENLKQLSHRAGEMLKNLENLTIEGRRLVTSDVA